MNFYSHFVLSFVHGDLCFEGFGTTLGLPKQRKESVVPTYEHAIIMLMVMQIIITLVV